MRRHNDFLTDDFEEDRSYSVEYFDLITMISTLDSERFENKLTKPLGTQQNSNAQCCAHILVVNALSGLATH